MKWQSYIEAGPRMHVSDGCLHINGHEGKFIKPPNFNRSDKLDIDLQFRQFPPHAFTF